MASLNESLATISGDLKVVYGKELVQTLPDAAICQKRWKLEDSSAYPAVGDYFSALIGVQFPWGLSFLGNGTEGTTTNYTLGDALAGQTKPAQIYANTTVMVDNLNYQILDRAQTSGGVQAVMSALSYTGEQMAINFRNVLEFQVLHGRQGLGASSGAISTLTVTFDGATTSIAILASLKGARVQFFQSNLTSARTAHDGSNYLTVDSVNIDDPAAPTITLVATGTTNVAAVTTGDVMFLGGSRGISVASSDTAVPFYEQIGLGSQLSTTTGTQFGIDKATYSGAWRANTIPSVGGWTPSALVQGASRSLARAGQLGEYVAIMHPDAWGVLNSALATNEVYTSNSGFSMSKKTGTDDIMVYNSGIKVECVPHPFQKRGQCYLFPSKELHRIGSVDMTFQVPGRPNDEFYFPVNGQAAMQRQCRADWQMALLKPPSGVILTGITY